MVRRHWSGRAVQSAMGVRVTGVSPPRLSRRALAGLGSVLGAVSIASSGCAAAPSPRLADIGSGRAAASQFLVSRNSLDLARSACGVPELSIQGGDVELVPGSGLTNREYVSRLMIMACDAGFSPSLRGAVDVVVSTEGDVPTALAITVDGGPTWRKLRSRDPQATASGSILLDPSRASFLLGAVLEWMSTVDPSMPSSAEDLYALFCGGSMMDVDQTPLPLAVAPAFRLIAADDVSDQVFGSSTRIEWGPSWPSPGRFEAPAATTIRGGSTALARWSAGGALSVQPVFLTQTIRRQAGACNNTYNLGGVGLSESERSALQARLLDSDQSAAANVPAGMSLCFAYEVTSRPPAFVSTSSGHITKPDGLFTVVFVQASADQADQVQQMNSFLLTRPDRRGASTCHRAVRQPRGNRNVQ